jgi:hypothetical protein
MKPLRLILLPAFAALAALPSSCKLKLSRELLSSATTATGRVNLAPSASTVLGLSGGSDVAVDTKLYDGLVPTISWTDSTGETSYEVSVLDATGSTVVCAPQTVAADVTSFSLSTGCSLNNGTLYKARVQAVWSDGATTLTTDSPLFDFHTGPFATIASANSVEYGVASVAVTLSQAAAVSISLDYVTADQSAFGGTDYIHRPTATLTFAPGETTKMISVPIFSNRNVDGNRAFRVELSNASAAVLDATTATITIQDNDYAPASGFVAVSAGREHTCGLTSSGGVRCWGFNGGGQLGDGTTTDRTTPVEVSGLTSGVAKISVGGYHSCALTTTGGMKC